MRALLAALACAVAIDSPTAWAQELISPDPGQGALSAPSSPPAAPLGMQPPSQSALPAPPPAGLYSPAASPFGAAVGTAPLSPPSTPPSLALTPSQPEYFPGGPIVASKRLSQWSITAEAVWLGRSTNNFGSLGESILAQAGTVIDQLNIGGVGLEPGMRLQLGYRLDEIASLEMVYLGMQQWTSSNTIYGDPRPWSFGNNGPLLITSPYTQSDAIIGPFDNSLGYTYRSSLQNLEFNQRIQRMPAGDWVVETLAGFRVLEWNERFHLNALNDANNPNNALAYNENIDISTHNTLVGGQLGYALRREWERLSLQFNGKVALMGNFVHSSYSNLNSTLWQSYGFSGSYPGFQPFAGTDMTLGIASVLDFGLVANFQITPNFGIRGGYQFLYIPGLALAPAQLNSFSHSQSVLLQGPTAGLSAQW